MSTPMQFKFLDAVNYRISLMPTFPDPCEDDVMKLTRDAKRICADLNVDMCGQQIRGNTGSNFIYNNQEMCNQGYMPQANNIEYLPPSTPKRTMSPVKRSKHKVEIEVEERHKSPKKQRNTPEKRHLLPEQKKKGQFHLNMQI